MSSISSSAWNLMPASIVNSLSSSQINNLAIDQITTLVNSPSYSLFSSSIVSSVQETINNYSPLLNYTQNNINTTKTNSANRIKEKWFYLILITIYLVNFK